MTNFRIKLSDSDGTEYHTTLRRFARDNDSDPWLAEQVAKLQPGESVTFGGGAAAAVTVTRCAC